MQELKDYSLRELEDWAKRIEDVACSLGVDFYPQEFEVVDYQTMLGLLAYHGIPSYYPHWSFGKAYERQATLYKYGLTYLPYELVINSNPSIAYLMNENSLPLQILTMAHVYGHNNFFKNNVNFQKGTRADLALEFFRASAERIRDYKADPSIGSEKVEECLDAAHAIMYNCSRIPGLEYISQEEKANQLKSWPRANHHDQWAHLKKVDKESNQQIQSTNFPLEPEENLLLFMRDYSPKRLEEWQKDIITIVAKSFDYFKVQILTKIMNEGWATYWHSKVIKALSLSADLGLAIDKYHSGVVRPPDDPYFINPYHIGLEMWLDVERRYENPTKEEQEEYNLSGGEGLKRISHVMRTADDPSFLRAYLTKELMAHLNLISHKEDDKYIIVDKVANERDWKIIKQLLIRDVGLGSIPVIKIISADHEDARSMYLKHYFDERGLEQEYTQKTLDHIHYFWGRPLYLETVTYKRREPFIYKYDGRSHSKYRRR